MLNLTLSLNWIRASRCCKYSQILTHRADRRVVLARWGRRFPQYGAVFLQRRNAFWSAIVVPRHTGWDTRLAELNTFRAGGYKWFGSLIL